MLKIEATVIDVTSNVTLPAITQYVASTTIIQTKTVVPARVTSTTTKVLYTMNVGRPTVSIVKVTKVVTPTCSVPARQATGDPICRIKPTVGGQQVFSIATAAVPALATAPALSKSSKFKKLRVSGRSVEFDKETFVRERSERLAARQLHKRAPDLPTATVTDTNTADYQT